MTEYAYQVIKERMQSCYERAMRKRSGYNFLYYEEMAHYYWANKSISIFEYVQLSYLNDEYQKKCKENIMGEI